MKNKLLYVPIKHILQLILNNKYSNIPTYQIRSNIKIIVLTKPFS